MFGTAACADRSVHLIETNPEAIVKHIKPNIRRNLTEKEWDEYIGPSVHYRQTLSLK